MSTRIGQEAEKEKKILELVTVVGQASTPSI